MPKIAILADIHSNFPALEAVCGLVDSLGCQEIFCLGDIVGYGVQPSECIDFVQQRNMICVQGNHDAHVADDGSGGEYNFNYAATMAVQHNRKHLDEREISFLKQLPEKLNWDEKTLLVHGSPENRDNYLRYDFDLRILASAVMEEKGPCLIFFGHTHVPMAHNGQAPLRDTDGVYFIDPQKVMLFNPGIVGQPRDGNPEAAFMVWDSEEGTVTQHRAAYDYQKVRDMIVAANLPEKLGDRLLRGK